MAQQTILTPFAENGDKVQIPATAGDDQVSIDKGFPQIYSTKIAQGGKPPSREEFNGIFNLIFQHLYDYQTGKYPVWSDKLNYDTHAVVIYAGDGCLYSALQPSGPGVSGVGAKIPSANKTYWGGGATMSNFDLKTALEALRTDFSSHTRNYQNPHNVTKEQIGLGYIPLDSSQGGSGEIVPTLSRINSLNASDSTAETKLASARAVQELNVAFEDTKNLLNELTRITKEHVQIVEDSRIGEISMGFFLHPAFDKLNGSRHEHVNAEPGKRYNQFVRWIENTPGMAELFCFTRNGRADYSDCAFTMPKCDDNRVLMGSSQKVRVPPKNTNGSLNMRELDNLGGLPGLSGWFGGHCAIWGVWSTGGMFQNYTGYNNRPAKGNWGEVCRGVKFGTSGAYGKTSYVVPRHMRVIPQIRVCSDLVANEQGRSGEDAGYFDPEVENSLYGGVWITFTDDVKESLKCHILTRAASNSEDIVSLWDNTDISDKNCSRGAYTVNFTYLTEAELEDNEDFNEKTTLKNVYLYLNNTPPDAKKGTQNCGSATPIAILSADNPYASISVTQAEYIYAALENVSVSKGFSATGFISMQVTQTSEAIQLLPEPK